ncbi:MAG: hypothetical protein AAF571_04635 [Verrucomicrobiota bacterium]
MRLSIIGIFAFLLCNTHVYSNLLTNGSFENEPGSSLGSQGYYTQSITSSATTFTINGWTFGRLAGNNNGNPRFHWYETNDRPSWTNLPQDGDWAIQLNSDNRDSRLWVEQTVAVTAGLVYELSFHYIDESVGSFEDDEVGVTASISGVVTSSNSFQYRDDDFPASLTDTWRNETIRFTPGSSGNITIRFTDLIPSSNVQQNVLLDNISLQVVPEASAIIAFLTVTAACLVQRRQRKKRNAS